MKIMHNQSSKYVPNQLFDTQISNDDDYSSYKKQNKKIQFIKPNQTNIKQTFKKKNILFNDSTNSNINKIDQFRQYDLIKVKTQNSSSGQISKQYSPQKCNSDQSQNHQISQNQDIKKKNNKKVSLKKNNLMKLLMEDFEQNTDQQDNNYNKQQKIEESNHQNQNLQKNQGQSDYVQYVPNKKFNFLYNDIDFDSSDDQQQPHKRRSDSSQNQSENKVYFQSSKPKNIFLNEKQFQDSCQQDQNISQKTQISENSPKTSNDSTSKQITYITTTEFIRNYIKADEQYLKTPIPQNKYIQFILKRDKSKRKTDYVQYYLYDSKIIKQVIYIRKTNKYQIFAKENVQNPKAHPDLKYLTAQLQTNFLGNNFSLKYINKKTLQKTLAETISYEMNLLGLNGPRKINIYLPKDQNQNISHNENLQTFYSQKQPCKVSKFVNKQAKWNQQFQSYVLNMKGKGKVSSVKNFVIIRHKNQELSQKLNQQQTEQEQNNVIFGKVDKDRFNLVIGWPFSILQGLAIALSTFDRKFACE